MNHKTLSFLKLKPPPFMAAAQFVFLFIIFALLVCYAARCFTSRLTRCLTFAATTIFNRFFNVSCFNCFNSGHYNFLQQISFNLFYHYIYKKSIFWGKICFPYCKRIFFMVIYRRLYKMRLGEYLWEIINTYFLMTDIYFSGKM